MYLFLLLSETWNLHCNWKLDLHWWQICVKYVSFLSWSHLFNYAFWIGAAGTSFFTGFRIAIYSWIIKISKKVGMSKRERIQHHEGCLFFLFYRSKLMPRFVSVIPVSPDITLKGRCLQTLFFRFFSGKTKLLALQRRFHCCIRNLNSQFV